MRARLAFFLTDTPTTDISTLSLHDALPISTGTRPSSRMCWRTPAQRTSRQGSTSSCSPPARDRSASRRSRSEEHTSELQSRQYLVCRLLLGKKKARHARHTFLLSLYPISSR